MQKSFFSKNWPWIILIVIILSVCLFLLYDSFNNSSNQDLSEETIETVSEVDENTQDNQSNLPKNITYTDILEITNTLPHNPNSWLEGLFFYNGMLYESQGRTGQSAISKNINLSTNQAENIYSFPDDLYAEGSTVFNGKLYVLTYQNNKVLVFDPNTLELLNTLDYNNREGWGLTTDGEYLIASDGSANIYYMDENLNDLKTITVTEDGNPVADINELEYINGDLWANVWYSDDVLIIDKETGNVKHRIDFSELRNGTGEVLNGIAYNPETNKLYLTGKLWNQMFEFDFK